MPLSNMQPGNLASCKHANRVRHRNQKYAKDADKRQADRQAQLLKRLKKLEANNDGDN